MPTPAVLLERDPPSLTCARTESKRFAVIEHRVWKILNKLDAADFVCPLRSPAAHATQTNAASLSAVRPFSERANS